MKQDLVAEHSKQHPVYANQEVNEIFKIALDQANIRVFVYEMQNKILYFFPQSNGVPCHAPDNDCCTVDEILSIGLVAGEEATAFRALFARVETGEKSVEARFRFYDEGEPRWISVVLSSCKDAEGRTLRAIGTMQDVSGRVAIEQHYGRETQYRLAMLADARRVYEINVTRDRFVKLESIQDSTDCGCWQLYSKAMRQLCEDCVYPEDWDIFYSVALRENLLGGYESGKTEFYCEYRVQDTEGNTSWSSSATHLLKDPLSDDIKGFIYVKDIDAQKRRELELAEQAERDSLTGIYNRRTAERLIAQMLACADERQHFAFLTIDFDDFKFVNDNFGHAVGDQLLKQMALEVNMIVDECDVFARIGGDEFIVFLSLDRDEQRSERIAQLICDTVRQISPIDDNPYRPSVSIGVATYPDCGKDFAELYDASDKAMYRVKQHGKNSMGFYWV